MRRTIPANVVYCKLMFLLSLVFLVLCFSDRVDAATVESGTLNNTITWQYEDDGVLTISGNGGINSDINDYPWTAYSKYITEVHLGEGITSIGENSFKDCVQLTRLTLPASLRTIGEYAFSGCNQLGIDAFPEGLIEIGDYAFADCGSTEQLTVPNTVTRIGEGAIGFSGLKSISLPFVGESRWAYNKKALFGWIFSNGTTWDQYYSLSYSVENRIPYLLKTVTITDASRIPFGAFSGCEWLTNITINDGVTDIGEYAFAGISCLDTLSIPFVGKSRDKAGNEQGLFGYVFGQKTINRGTTGSTWTAGKGYYSVNQKYNNGSSVSYTLPKSLKTVIVTNATQIPYGAFSGCSRLKRISILDSPTSIGDRAFSSIITLSQCDIPNSVVTIGKNLFEGCNVIENLSIPFVGASRSSGGTKEGVLGYFFSETTEETGTRQFYSQTQSALYKIPKSIKQIHLTDSSIVPYGAFSECNGLTEVFLSEKTTIIDNCAFKNTGLGKIHLPDGLTSIHDNAFQNCTLSSLKLPENLKMLGNNVFNDCRIQSLIIQGSIESIGASTFYQNTTLDSVYVDDLRSWSEIDFANAYANPLMYASNMYVKGVLLSTDLQIPDGTVKVGSYAFYSLDNLRSVSIPDSVESIGDYAFADCVNLADVTMPNTITRVGEGAFDGCSELSSKELLGFEFTETTKTLVFGEKFTPTINYYPEDAIVGRGFTWKSNNEDVAIVDEYGKVTAVGAGSADIQATANGITKSYGVTIVKADPEYSIPTGVTTTCNSKLNSVVLPNGFIWVDDTLNVGSIGVYDFEATYVPNDTRNYNTITNLWITVLVRHGHSDKWVSNEDSHWKECACGDIISRENHKYGAWNVLTKPSCVEDGKRERKCIVCGHAETDIMPAVGHDWHKAYTVDRQATCIEEGQKSIHCSKCGEIKGGTTSSIPKTNHTYSEWIEIKKETCIETGSREKVCIVCGDKIAEDIPAKGHVWDSEYTVDKEASCTEEGQESIHCSVCDVIQTGTEMVVPKTNHHFGGWTVTEDATCTTSGAREKKCEDCGEVVAETIPATDHQWNSDYTVDKEATHFEKGIESIHCSVCNEIKGNSVKTISVIEHDFDDWIVITPATCTENGEKVHRCGDCGHEETQVIPATEHQWNSDYTIDKDPTCRKEGIESIHCLACGEVKAGSEKTVPQIEHLFGEWRINQASSCTDDGERQRFCTICGAWERDAIPARGHDWGSEYIVEKPATCTETGLETIHCEFCQDRQAGSERVIPKTAHNYGAWNDTKTATCTTKGSRERICKDCGDKITEVVPALGHTWSKNYTVDKKAACTAEGKESVHCSVCDEIKPGSSRTIARMTHNYGVWKTTKAATYTEKGTKEHACTVCGHKEQAQIPMLTRISIANASVANVVGKTYTGSALTQSPIVKVGSTTLKLGRDYTVSYENNTDVGTATIRIEGQGNYTGSQILFFEIIAKPVKNGWEKTSNNWYYYVDDVAVTGWHQVGSYWYYFNDNGIMQIGWRKVDGTWYYFNPAGNMRQGWLNDGGTWYYLGNGTADSGYMRTGWVKVGGTWYYFSDGGAMVNGWQKINSTWYYFDASGAMLTGWQKIGGVWYYLKSSGAMAANEWCSGYWLNANGSWIYQPKGSWKKDARGWWYGDTSGYYEKGKTVKIDGKAYAFDASGYWRQ